MLIELHSHTFEHSPCSRIPAVELIRLVHRAGADGIVLTDHHYLWPREKLAELRTLASVGDDFVILAGQEIFTEDFGDVLVYGATESINPGPLLSDLRQDWPQAALVWAHPYRYGFIPSRDDLLDCNLNAVEIVNPHQKPDENRKGISDWKAWSFPATSGTDIHSSESRVFNFTILDGSIISSIGDLVDSIKNGNCSPTYAGTRL